MRNSGLFVAIVGTVMFASGVLVGSRNAPQPQDSMLAQAQVVAQDRDVRYIGYLCGDDGATVLARELPSECQNSFRLPDDQEFPAPPPHFD